MKTKIALLIALALTLLPAAKAAKAQDMLSLSVGYFDIFDDQEAVNLGVEYRPDSVLFVDNLKPWAGAELTTDGTLWAGGGLLLDWEFTPNWYFTPSAGVGLYSRGSSKKKLDHPIEFRTQLEFSYEYEESHRIGLALSHKSNAGLGNSNPGVEVLSLYWHIPLDKIF